MSKLEDKALEAIERFEKLAETHSDEFIEFSLTVARVDILHDLIYVFAGLILSVFLIFLAWRLIRKSIDIDRERRKLCNDGSQEAREKMDELPDDEPYGFGGLASGALGAVFLVISLLYLLNAWYWAGLVNPEIWIAKEIMNL